MLSKWHFFLLPLLVVCFFLVDFKFKNKPYCNEEGECVVSIYDQRNISPGINVFTSPVLNKSPSIFFTDNQGSVIKVIEFNHKNAEKLENIKIKNNFMYGIFQDKALAKYDLKGERIWQKKGSYHHDLDVFQGKIYSLKRSPEVNHTRKVIFLNDSIDVLDEKTGNTLQSISFIDILSSYIKDNMWDKSQEYFLTRDRSNLVNSSVDFFHTNSIEIIECKDISICKSGKLALLSLAHMDLILLYSFEQNQIVWTYSEGLERQHQPSYVGNDRILLFDNGNRRGYSRVLEIDILSKRVTWSYPRDKQAWFYSPEIGGAQRLKNGNTLINLGMHGKVFEVTPKNEIVWKFINPVVLKGENSYESGHIYRMHRYTGLVL